MRATIHLGLICVTISLVAFLKYFAGPVALERTKNDFLMDMTGPRLVPRSTDKIKYIPPPTPPSVLYPLSSVL